MTWYEKIYGVPPPVNNNPAKEVIVCVPYNEEKEDAPKQKTRSKKQVPWYVREARETNGYWTKEDARRYIKSLKNPM